MISLFLNLKDDRLDMERDTDDEVSAGQVLTGQEVSDNFANFLTILPFSVELLCKAPEPDPPTPEPTQTPEPEDTGPPPAISRTNVFSNVKKEPSNADLMYVFRGHHLRPLT